MLACASKEKKIVITPDDPASLQVTVAAGQAVLADGKKVSFPETVLPFDPPAVIPDSTLNSKKRTTAPTPLSYTDWFKPWQPWPTQGKPVTLMPGVATEHNPVDFILGGLYRAIDPEWVKVFSADGKPEYKRDTDYIFNPDWGQIANLNDRIKAKEIRVTYKYVPQRLDLIQVDGAGKLSIKKGISLPVCPRLPEPDTGCTGLAGVHIATYDKYTISQDDICVIDPAPRVEPINAKALAKTIAPF